MRQISKNTKDTAEIARRFMKKLRPQKNRATIVGLYGDLGTGKTAFTQAAAKVLGIKRKVNSPTYVIMKKYMLYKQRGHKNFLANNRAQMSTGENFHARTAFRYFFHLDAYRLKNEKELRHLGWDEIISQKEHLIFIEWPENVLKAMPKKHHKISISHLPTRQVGMKEGHRKFDIKGL